MAHTNNFREKREEQHNAHNRKAGVAKFQRNLKNRRRRRWSNRVHKEWVQDRDDELGKSISAARYNRNNKRQGAQSKMSAS